MSPEEGTPPVEEADKPVPAGTPFQRTVAVDFDGVIHAMSRGYGAGDVYDHPVPGAFRALRQLRALGYRLVIHTTRGGNAEQKEAIRQWFVRAGAPDLADIRVTNVKPIASVYLDDRAVRFTTWTDALALLT